MRADRLLSTLLLLQVNAKMTVRRSRSGSSVAADDGARSRSVERGGRPVLALRCSPGGRQLDQEWRTRVPGLDDAELRAFQWRNRG